LELMANALFRPRVSPYLLLSNFYNFYDDFHFLDNDRLDCLGVAVGHLWLREIRFRASREDEEDA